MAWGARAEGVWGARTQSVSEEGPVGEQDCRPKMTLLHSDRLHPGGPQPRTAARRMLWTHQQVVCGDR